MRDRVSGVYVVHGNNGRVYVGQAVDCARRNRRYTRLGIEWEVVRRLPHSTRQERIRVEVQVAREMMQKGFKVVSNHGAVFGRTNRHQRPTQQQVAAKRKERLRQYWLNKDIASSA